MATPETVPERRETPTPPETPPDPPADGTLDLSGYTPLPVPGVDVALLGCGRCGTFVADPEQHDEWHGSLDARARLTLPGAVR